MTLTIELEPGMEREITKEATRQGLTPEELAERAMEMLIAGLKDQRIPQSLDEIKPKRLPPPGKTAMQMVYQQLLSDEAEESNEESRMALEELS